MIQVKKTDLRQRRPQSTTFSPSTITILSPLSHLLQSQLVADLNTIQLQAAF